MNRQEAKGSELQQAYAVCSRHAHWLSDALSDLDVSAGNHQDELTSDNKELIRIMDQFAYRYTRLQDEMGARLMPAILATLGEDVKPMPAIDRFNRLEQLGWIPSADEWLEHREIRNQFTHEYPERPDDHLEKLRAAMTSANRLIEIFSNISERLKKEKLI